MIFVIIVLALFLNRVQYLAAKKNIGAKWNGWGAIPSVRAKTADAPMAYRVLVPWLNPTFEQYQFLQFVFIWLAITAIYLAWGTEVMITSVALLIVTLYYDYWDVWIEVAALSFALVSFPLALLAMALHSMSRETAPLVGVVYFLRTKDSLGAIIIITISIIIMGIVRLIQGEHLLYCKRWMWRENISLALKPSRPIISSPAHMSIVLCALGLCGAIGRLDGIIVPIIIGASFLMAKFDETRVLSPIIPYAALFLLRLI